MLKRTLSIAVSILMIFALFSGCSQSGSITGDNTVSPTSAENPTSAATATPTPAKTIVPMERPSGKLGLYIESGKLMYNNKEFRAIGANYFDAFYSTLCNPSDKSYKDVFTMLNYYDIPFARVNLGAFWPVDFKMYDSDRDKYFAIMDDVIKTAEDNNVGLICSLFWNYSMLPDYCKESMNAWGDKNSKTRQKMREYITAVVTRYKDNPAIWGWEFGNEWNLMADLPNAKEFLPEIHADLGTQTKRSNADIMTTEIIASAMTDFADQIRKLDPDRIITSGNGTPRPSQYNQYASLSWNTDTREEMAEAIKLHTPGKMDTVSFHLYDAEEKRCEEASTVEGLLKVGMEESVKMGKILFAGEFGSQASIGDQTKPKFERILNAIVDAKVPISAVWVVGRSGDNEWNITATNDRSYMLDEIKAANQKIMIK